MYGNARHPMLVKWKVAASADGKIEALDCESFIDAGCSEDFSGFIMGEASFGAVQRSLERFRTVRR